MTSIGMTGLRSQHENKDQNDTELRSTFVHRQLYTELNINKLHATNHYDPIVSSMDLHHDGFLRVSIEKKEINNR